MNSKDQIFDDIDAWKIYLDIYIPNDKKSLVECVKRFLKEYNYP